MTDLAGAELASPPPAPDDFRPQVELRLDALYANQGRWLRWPYTRKDAARRAARALVSHIGPVSPHHRYTVQIAKVDGQWWMYATCGAAT